MAVAKMSVLVEETLGDQDEDVENLEMPLPNVHSVILEKVLDFCKQYKDSPMSPIQTPLRSHKLEELVQDWYAEFVRVPKEQLFELVAAANYMDIKPLLDLTCLAVSILIKGKSVGELREMFNLSADLSPEEEAEARASMMGGSTSSAPPAPAGEAPPEPMGST
jgi:S-phase kinase-associated protein 1